MAVPLLDLPARPRVHRQGRPHPRPVRRPLGRRAAASRRLRRLLRREALDPSAAPQARDAARRGRVERGQRVEHEYERKGALCYLAAWDARRAKLFDRCAAKDGIVPFDALVEQFMTVEPYSKAQRVFVIVDNGSAHRGKRSIDRLQGAWPEPDPRPHPHPRQLAQPGRDLLLDRPAQGRSPPTTSPTSTRSNSSLLAFGRRYEQIAAPFQWKFTRADLDRLAQRLEHTPLAQQPDPRIRRRTSEPEHLVIRPHTVSESRPALAAESRAIWRHRALADVLVEPAGHGGRRAPCLGDEPQPVGATDPVLGLSVVPSDRLLRRSSSICSWSFG